MKKILILFVSLCFCVTLFAQKKIKVACVGNSMFWLYTLPDRETNAYPAKLQKMLGMIMWLVTLKVRCYFVEQRSSPLYAAGGIS